MRNLKRALSLTLASVMLLGMMVVGSSAAGYPDVSEEENIEAIEVLQAVGVMGGDENGNFNPDDYVTREQMAVIMSQLLNLDYNYYKGTNPFSDVPEWAAPYVAACAANGITAGIGGGLYGSKQNIQAVQAALMMLKALGYFQYSGDYGDNYILATVKQGSEIGLFNDIDSNADSPLTRNQVAQMVLNALESNMVTFKGDVGATIPTPNGDVVIGYRADYQFRTGTDKKYNALVSGIDRTDINNQGQYYIQLGEELYDGKLTKKADTDDFARPATTWRYDGKDIGTYADEADATYTKKVEVGDIYKDLGLGSTIPSSNVTVFVDGVEGTGNEVPYAIKKGNDTNKYGDNGVLTQVFYDKDNNSVIITEVNTWVGTISKSVAASGNKDAYVIVAPESVKPANMGGNQEFETEDAYDDDAYVLYTYSQAEKEITSVALAQSVSGDATRVENAASNEDSNKAIVIEGDSYKFSAKNAGVSLGEVSVGNGYEVYLDAYGYAIYVEEIDEIGEYALVLGTQDKGDFSSSRALLIFADGTEEVVNTDKNYKPTNAAVASNTNKNAIYPGTIVTYREENGVYTLKPVKKTIGTDTITDGTPTFGGVGTNNEFVMENDKAGVRFTNAAADTKPYIEFEARTTAGSEAKSAPTTISTNDKGNVLLNANSKTIFVVYSVDEDEYHVYNGIKEAPSIKPTSTNYVNAYAYCKNGTMARVMFIFVQKGVDINDENSSLLFLTKESVGNLIHDTEGDYFVYNAVVGSEITTVKVDANPTVGGVPADGKNLNGLYKSYKVNSKGIITGLTTYTAFDNTTKNEQAVNPGIGVDKKSDDYTVIVNTQVSEKTITVDDNAKIYSVDKKGNISEMRYSSISKDEDDKVYAVVKDWMVQHLFIETVDTVGDAATPSGTITGGNTVATGAELTLTANATVSDGGTLSYQWYKHSDDTLDIDHITNATKLNGETGATLTITGETEDEEFYYYCVVTNKNDEVDGNSTAQALLVSGKVTTTGEPGQQIGVRVEFYTNPSDTSTLISAQSVKVEGDFLGYGKVTADDVAKYIPGGYKLTTDSGLPKEIEDKDVVKVKVEARDDVTSIELVDPNKKGALKHGETTSANIATDMNNSGIQFKVNYGSGDTAASRVIAANETGVTYTDKSTNSSTKNGAITATYGGADVDINVELYAALAAKTNWSAGTDLSTNWDVKSVALKVADGKVQVGDVIEVVLEQKNGADFGNTEFAALGSNITVTPTGFTVETNPAVTAKLTTEGKDADASGNPAAVKAEITFTITVESVDGASASGSVNIAA